MKSIRKAVIPAAGFGTRFLPATKAQPKEMLPIVDTPAIQYIVKAWMLNYYLIARIDFNVFTFNTVIRCMLKCHGMLRRNHTLLYGTSLPIIR